MLKYKLGIAALAIGFCLFGLEALLLVLFGHITIAALVLGIVAAGLGLWYIYMASKINAKLREEIEKEGFKATIRGPSEPS